MDTELATVLVALIALLGNIVMWVLNWRAKKSDKVEEISKQMSANIEETKKLRETVKELTELSETYADGLRVTLHDRLRYLGQLHIRAKEIDLDDRANLIQMHDAYHALGGNGNLDALMHQIEKLPLKGDSVFDLERAELMD